MKKIRKFEGGGNVRSDDPSVDRAADAEEARYKAAGLAAKKSSSFGGLGRLFQGNIDQEGSEAYEKYGAGAGRRLEAEKAKKAEIAETAPEFKMERRNLSVPNAKGPEDTKRNGREEDAPVSTQRTGREEDAPVKTVGKPNETAEAQRMATAPLGPSDTADMKRVAVSVARAPASAPVVRNSSAPIAKNTSDSDYRGPMERRNLSVPALPAGSAGQKGPSRADLENDARRGFAANPMSKDPSQRSSSVSGPRSVANPTTKNPVNPETGKSVKPLSQAELRAQALTARATGNSSGLASNKRVPTPSEAGQNIKNAAEKVGNAFSSIANSFKKEKYKEKNGKAKGGAIKGYASGGSVSSRGDGIAQRGKTRGRMC